MPETSKTANPFPGLRPFEPGETHLFFGREGQSREIIRRLERTRFLAVVGTSGSGKSSLVRAGLLPALRGGVMTDAGAGWRIAIVRPGDNPIGNLAAQLASPEVFGSEEASEAAMQRAFTEAALRRSSLGLLDVIRQARAGEPPRMLDYENLLILIDQFEELFRFRSLIEVENSKEDAAAFVSLLLEAARQREVPVYVVLTMRSDFLGDCAQFQGLPEAINDGQYLIPRMTRDERRSAITGPVAFANAAITEPLVNQLLNDMGDNPDQLPILQHALMRTWDEWQKQHRNGEPIDLPHYNAIGGMGQALSKHAEEAYGELGEPGQEQSARQRVAEKLFKALTEKGPDNREVRRPVSLREASEIAETSEAEVAGVVEVFRRAGRSFLMPPVGVSLDADSLIDISHESLIRNWGRLRLWADEEAQSARIYKRLAETAVLHKAGEEGLLKDPALQVALDWRARNRPNHAWARRYHTEFDTASNFLDASVKEREKELLELKKRQRREVSYKRTRLAALFLALSFLLSLAASVYAYNSRSMALASEARAVNALRQAEKEREDATFARHEAETQAQKALADKAQATRQLDLAEAAKAEADRHAAAAGESEKRANAALNSANAALSQARAQSARNALVAEKNAAETKQARQLLYPTIINLAQQAYASNNIERGREMLSLQQTAIGDRPGFEWFYMNHLLYNEKETIEAPEDDLKFVAASSDGKTLVVASGRMIDFRDLATGETRTVPIARASDEEFSVGCIAISPDGKKLALGNSNAAEPSVKLYDIGTRKELGALKAGTRSINTIAFTADSKSLIVGSGPLVLNHASPRPFINIWDVDSLTLKGDILSDPYSNDFAVSPDGKTVALVRDHLVKLWDLSSNKEVGDLAGDEAQITSLAFSPDGRQLITGSMNNMIKWWDVAERKSQLSLGYKSPAFSLAFSPDGNYLAAGFADGTITICGKGGECAFLKGHRETVTSLSFSPDSRLLFSCDNQRTSNLAFNGSEDATVKSWDVVAALREQTPVPDIENRGIVVLAYSPDGKTLVATGDNSKVMLLDAETNRLLRTLYETERSVNAVAFSPDGRALATADAEEVRLWNVSTGAHEAEPLKVKGVNSLVFSQGGRLLVTASPYNGTVTAWDVATRRELRTARGKSDDDYNVAHLSLSPDGTALVFTRNNVLEFWDAGLEKQLRRSGLPLTDEGVVTSLAHSPDGRLIAVGDSFKRAVLLDAQTLSLINTIQLQKEEIHTLAFSPDGKTLVTGGESGTLKLWSTASFREMLTLTGYASAIRAATFSPDGTKLSTVDNESNVRVWRAPVPVEAALTTMPVGGF